MELPKKNPTPKIAEEVNKKIPKKKPERQKQMNQGSENEIIKIFRQALEHGWGQK